MIRFPKELKPTVLDALIQQRQNFGGTNVQFAKRYDIDASVVHRIVDRGVRTENIMLDAQWMNLARLLGVEASRNKWHMARTEVYAMIEEDITFCQQNSKALLLVDDAGIGKTFSAKYLSRTLKNCLYIDASQCTTKPEFIRAIAHNIGLPSRVRMHAVRDGIKHAIRTLEKPCIIIDEAGALTDEAAMFIKELWNATEGQCGWYLMGADGLRAKIERKLKYDKVGWAELFSRFNDKYNSIVPKHKDERIIFYKRLITDVLTVNMENKSNLKQIVTQCLTNDSGRISGLRRAETLLLLHTA